MKSKCQKLTHKNYILIKILCILLYISGYNVAVQLSAKSIAAESYFSFFMSLSCVSSAHYNRHLVGTNT